MVLIRAGVLFYSVLFFFFPSSWGFSTSLSEKRHQLVQTTENSSDRSDLQAIQEGLVQRKEEIKSLYEEMQAVLFSEGMQDLGPEQIQAIEQFKDGILQLQREIRKLEEEWKRLAEEDSLDDFEGLWHQPDTTVGQLVIDYSSGDAVFVMPPEIAAYKIHLNSKLSVPKAAWDDMLSVILSNFGIGIKSLSPFVKQLYFLRMNQSGLHCITDERNLVSALPLHEKIAYVCSPPTGDLRRVLQFLERFAPQESVSVQIVGGHLLLVGPVREIQDLLKVYDFIVSPTRAQEHKIVTLQRGSSEEVAKILSSIFEGEGIQVSDAGGGDKAPSTASFGAQDGSASFGFRVIALKSPASSLFIMGKREQIEKACQIIDELETSIGKVKERGIHWYACRHSEAEELAKVLSQVYKRMTGLGADIGLEGSKKRERPTWMEWQREKIEARAHAQDALIIESEPVKLPSQAKPLSDQEVSEHFIVDPKTNSIIMVVENYLLPKLRELLHKLDVPKRMVQIDVLLFEKRVNDSSSIGLTNLKLGDVASDRSKTKVFWNGSGRARARNKKKTNDENGKEDSKNERDSDDNGMGGLFRGILHFFTSQSKTGWFPAWDAAYQFLLSQDDIQINANPSITTINQTPAKIAIVEQISINTGVVELDRDHVKDSYSRNEYGITLQITPTIHAKADDGETGEPKYVTLATDILFDNPQAKANDRPDVMRRNIKNEVRVKDGETVILGGLRRKLSSGQKQMIPFLGEIPGLGKLFSMSTLSDESTEMIVFLTPHILPDEHEEWNALRAQQLAKRPGDTPEFLQEVLEAREEKKKGMMSKSLRMFLGSPSVAP